MVCQMGPVRGIGIVLLVCLAMACVDLVSAKDRGEGDAAGGPSHKAPKDSGKDGRADAAASDPSDGHMNATGKEARSQAKAEAKQEKADAKPGKHPVPSRPDADNPPASPPHAPPPTPPASPPIEVPGPPAAPPTNDSEPAPPAPLPPVALPPSSPGGGAPWPGLSPFFAVPDEPLAMLHAASDLPPLIPGWTWPTAVLHVSPHTLDASGSFAEGSTIVAYRFTGPGLSGTWQESSVASFQAGGPGPYVVRLDVRDAAGHIDSVTTTVYVSHVEDRAVPVPWWTPLAALAGVRRR